MCLSANNGELDEALVIYQFVAQLMDADDKPHKLIKMKIHLEPAPCSLVLRVCNFNIIKKISRHSIQFQSS